MTTIRLPNGWVPRAYQRPAWDYLERGGRHAELIWHRRAGKDEISMHMTACKAFERVGTYWHMLPLASQARKAIWNAINGHSGKRRIDEAFPPAIRKRVNDQEMFIEFVNGSTWQVMGSDNYNAMVGAPPVGLVYSEWALANPAARAYLRPIIAENKGWEVFITTPRGKNHALRTLNAARKDPEAFAQVLSARETGIFDDAQLAKLKAAYIADFGEDMGAALFEQEYLCSFDAAVIGAFYSAEFRRVDQEGRICRVPHDPAYPIFTSWDLGRTDDTSIWWFQIIAGEIRVIDFHTSSGKKPGYYASQITGREVEIDLIGDDLVISKGGLFEEAAHRIAYDYEMHFLPHDARAKTLAAKGKSLIEQYGAALGVGKMSIVPDIGVLDGINAARTMFPRVYFDEERCSEGTDALREYRRQWDDEKKVFSPAPLHNWASNPADAFRMMAVAWKHDQARPIPQEPDWENMDTRETLNDVWADHMRHQTNHRRL
jgi:phage terminase large subunit